MVIVFLVDLLGIVIVSAVVAIIHDLIVDKWAIQNINATGVPATAPGHGAKILQLVTASFDAQYKHLFFGRLFGPIQPVAWVIELKLDPDIVRCDQTLPQYCPLANGGVGTRYRHVEAKFVIQWDAFGTHEVPINITFDGTQITNTSGQQDLKISMTIT